MLNDDAEPVEIKGVVKYVINDARTGDVRRCSGHVKPLMAELGCRDVGCKAFRL
ncbi:MULTISPECIES: hypothetical protein [Enterobacterales]|uniref:hypothetical protein n=1 Tax=Enterobacterales TaxID=91347 RepID=UPI002EDAAD10